MVNLAINLGIFTIAFFILGMIKPKWPLFFLEKPDRLNIIFISTIMVMIVITLFGEGHRRNVLEQQKKSKPTSAEVAPAKNQPDKPSISSPKTNSAVESTQDIVKSNTPSSTSE